MLHHCVKVATSLAKRSDVRPSFGRVIASLYYSSEAKPVASKETIDKLVKADKVVVFMKGVPDEPLCGFSNAVSKILQMHEVPFTAHDVLKDESIREGVKEYSDWKTIPQVFINGEFVGGCDIMMDYHKSGELLKLLEKAGMTSALKNMAPPISKKT